MTSPRERASSTPRRRVYRFEVEAPNECEPDELAQCGQVILPDLATCEEVEHALVSLGLYVPRGADRLEWCDGNLIRARIFDARGDLLAQLTVIE